MELNPDVSSGDTLMKGLLLVNVSRVKEGKKQC